MTPGPTFHFLQPDIGKIRFYIPSEANELLIRRGERGGGADLPLDDYGCMSPSERGVSLQRLPTLQATNCNLNHPSYI